MFSKSDSKISISKCNSATTVYFQRLFRKDTEKRLEEQLENLLEFCPEHERGKYVAENKGFLKLFQKYNSIPTEPRLYWEEIEPMPRGSYLNYDSYLNPRRHVIQSLLKKLVVVKLNGGLGTTMKCDGPKSLIPVRNDLTFLDMTVQQIENLNTDYETNVPLVLMNSFYTSEHIEPTLQKYKNLKIKIYTFMQNRYPRIYADNLTPVPNSYNDEDNSSWYPPGHGNFYEAFHESGLIHKFMQEGKEVCFVSNIDNLGATVDFKILNLMASSYGEEPSQFIMEITKKTPADIKGGTLINYKGKLKLLEYAQVPKDHIDDFKSMKKFENFNTNNLWINLQTIAKLVSENALSLDLIVNKKQILRNGIKLDVIQLETASGAAIQSFERAISIRVPRTRFLPVKRTSDLFILRSNTYILDNGKLIVNPLRPFPDIPLVSLTDEHFGDFRFLDKRFASIPDCLNLQHLTISGDVYFGKNVALKGNVTIVANNGERIDIPPGAILQFNIVTGSLRILDY